MTRIIFALLAIVTLSAAAPVDHARTMVATADGFRIGSATARVKLVEYASLTCSHCRAFHIDGSAALKAKYIASGLVSYEIRNMVLNGPDFAASVLARCRGPEQFFTAIDLFYRQQQEWVTPFTLVSDAENARYAGLPDDQQLAAVAVGGKLDMFVAAHGIDRATFDKCLADKAASERLNQIGQTAMKTYKVRGTPTFFINGAIAPANTWAGIEPLLRKAIAFKPRTGRK
jgi:protein-disulfide isomerase